MKLSGKVVQKAENQDESATIDVETEAGSRLNFDLSREEARGHYAAGTEVTIEVTEHVPDAKEVEAAEAAKLEPSEETMAAMGEAPKAVANSGGTTPAASEVTGSGSTGKDSASKSK